VNELIENVVVVGLGYVGLPVALAFSKVCGEVVGLDIDEVRVAELKSGFDRTLETSRCDLHGDHIRFTADPACIKSATLVIVTVPTPTDKSNRPDLTLLKKACQSIGRYMEPGVTIVFESTVYPTATEQFCAPILEQCSGMRSGVGFKLGYSPERINPGDKTRSISDIKKVVSGQDADTLEKIATAYESIISAGVHRASSIAVAEASKVIENTQRDLNIALMNELAIICDKLEISTNDVIEAAATKWNFLKFTPGLVGGHCIGVDPYYLTAKAEELGYHPGVILSGRRINDSMGEYIAHRIVRLLSSSDLPVRKARVGILGLTFKENVPDFRNSKVFDIVRELNSYGIVPIADDPFMESYPGGLESEIEVQSVENFSNLHCLVLAVPHEVYVECSADTYSGALVEGGIFVDIKSQFSAEALGKNITYWAL
jgi:UDP-N-acetyl-D-glucosamine/UDP-N-acetyl-D-galactosamine dehydrogenase